MSGKPYRVRVSAILPVHFFFYLYSKKSRIGTRLTTFLRCTLFAYVIFFVASIHFSIIFVLFERIQSAILLRNA